MTFAVVYGSPGVGKTTLVSSLSGLSVVEEPTNTPEIREMIADMYAGKPGAAARLQGAILDARIRLLGQLEENAVVVCDGHPLTDLLIYGALHRENGSMSAEEYAAYEHRVLKSTAHMPPTFFVQLIIGGDHDGSKHGHRVHKLRASQEEAGVDSAVFKQMSALSQRAPESISAIYGNAALLATIDTDGKTPEQVRDEFLELLKTIA